MVKKKISKKKKVKKIKLIGVGKDESRCWFSFSKQQQFFEIMRNFFLKLDLWDEETRNYGFGWSSREHDYTNKEEDIKKITDRINHFLSEDYSIDIIFGKDKVFVIINTKKDKQQFISKALEEFIED